MTRFLSTVGAIFLVAILSLGYDNAIASAGPIDPTLQALESTEESLPLGSAPLKNLTNQAGVPDDNSISFENLPHLPSIPASDDNPLTLRGIEILMPNDGEISERELIREGAFSYQNSNGTTQAPLVKSDGSIQIATILDNNQSPETFNYIVGQSDVTTLVADSSGAVLVQENGEFAMAIAPPWAVDAKGEQVPTRFEVRGNTLTQVVQHQARNYKYPIVADPWFGIDIFGAVTQNYSLQRISGTLTPWGSAIQTGVAVVGGWAVGQTVLRTAGWDEWSTKAPLSKSKATYHQQFDCHVLGAYTPVTGGSTWDLEGTRANRPNWLTDGGAYPFKCNWP